MRGLERCEFASLHLLRELLTLFEAEYLAKLTPFHPETQCWAVASERTAIRS
jgi:hypothetical protein